MSERIITRLTFDQLGLEAVGDEKPSDRYLGTLDIEGTLFHVEFIAVRVARRTGVYYAVDKALESNVEAVCQINGADFTPVEYNGRKYCVSIVAYAR